MKQTGGVGKKVALCGFMLQQSVNVGERATDTQKAGFHRRITSSFGNRTRNTWQFTIPEEHAFA